MRFGLKNSISPLNRGVPLGIFEVQDDLLNFNTKCEETFNHTGECRERGGGDGGAAPGRQQQESEKSKHFGGGLVYETFTF